MKKAIVLLTFAASAALFIPALHALNIEHEEEISETYPIDVIHSDGINQEYNVIEGKELDGAFFPQSLEKNLTGANLNRANLSYATLSDFILSWSSLIDANLQNAILNHTDFSNANLRQADFTGADLSGATFSGADIRGVNFQDAYLENTDFNGAIYDERTNFIDADFGEKGFHKTVELKATKTGFTQYCDETNSDDNLEEQDSKNSETMKMPSDSMNPRIDYFQETNTLEKAGIDDKLISNKNKTGPSATKEKLEIMQEILKQQNKASIEQQRIDRIRRADKANEQAKKIKQADEIRSAAAAAMIEGAVSGGLGIASTQESGNNTDAITASQNGIDKTKESRSNDSMILQKIENQQKAQATQEDIQVFFLNDKIHQNNVQKQKILKKNTEQMKRIFY